MDLCVRRNDTDIGNVERTYLVDDFFSDMLIHKAIRENNRPMDASYIALIKGETGGIAIGRGIVFDV